MDTIRSMLDLLQHEKLLVDEYNELVNKCRGDINKLSDDDATKLVNTEASIRMTRKLISGYLDEDFHYGIPTHADIGGEKNGY